MKALLGQLPGLLVSAVIVLVVCAGLVRSQVPLDNLTTGPEGDYPCSVCLNLCGELPLCPGDCIIAYSWNCPWCYCTESVGYCVCRAD